jgi:NDP-sugar pyrophosphorylase family protein
VDIAVSTFLIWQIPFVTRFGRRRSGNQPVGHLLTRPCNAIAALPSRCLLDNSQSGHDNAPHIEGEHCASLLGIVRRMRTHRLVRQAVILAGGRGRRLVPFTKFQPKSLLRIQKGTLLGLLIHNLETSGVPSIHVAAGYLGDAIAEYVTPRFPACQVSQQTIEIGTAGDGLLFLQDRFSQGDLLVVHGDHFFYDNPFPALLSKHLSGSITFLLQDATTCSSLGYNHHCLYNAATGEVKFRESVSTRRDSMWKEMVLVDGCMVVPCQIFRLIRESRAAARNQRLEMRDTFRFIAERKLLPMSGVEVSGWWANINDVEVYSDTLKRLYSLREE